MAETNEKDTTKSEIFIAFARVFCLIASPLSFCPQPSLSNMFTHTCIHKNTYTYL
ncbi:unnamed protein product [Arabidopsis lyrata]|uniref:Predicted protein n=1 Tax=Arabidopsis lyrata subsp. lyrata TaxID=81972 RepID=D7KKA1_ARALL|nr:predicted protein [Arabidopsis lyrata subsp. lyrata]CAH8254101.1 unnamed protein product [Arabidopsis lyrata]